MGTKNHSVSNLIYIAHDGSRWTVSDFWLGRGPNPPSDHGASLECCRDLSSPWRSKQSIKQSPRCWAGLRTKHAPCVSHMAASFAKVTLQMDIASSTFVRNKCWAVVERPSPPRLKLAAFRKLVSATGQTQSHPLQSCPHWVLAHLKPNQQAISKIQSFGAHFLLGYPYKSHRSVTLSAALRSAVIPG